MKSKRSSGAEGDRVTFLSFPTKKKWGKDYAIVILLNSNIYIINPVK